MQRTPNYKFKKPELIDSPPDITVLNENFDIIDEKLKELNDGKAPKDVATTSLNGLMSKTDKSKLDGIAANANKYAHPKNHPATMITEDTTHRFATDEEKNKWNGKADANHSHKDKASLNADVYFISVAVERVTGNSDADKVYLGNNAFRIDTTEGITRLYNSWWGSPDSGIQIKGDGTIEIKSFDITRHIFNSNGTKTGGTMEVDGTVYGMSPTDSPQTLIEYIIPDVVLEGELKLELDPIYIKMISYYVAFLSNKNIEIKEKGKDYITLVGNGVTDILIKGQRKGAEEYFRIMGGLDHGVTEGKTV